MLSTPRLGDGRRIPAALPPRSDATAAPVAPSSRATFREDDLDDFLKLTIETHDAVTRRIRRSEAWAAVHDGRLYLRARHGRRTAWYRDVLADPRLTISVGGRRIGSIATPATGGARATDVTSAFLRRYGYHPAMPDLLAMTSLEATIEAVPTLSASQTSARERRSAARA